MEQTTFAEQSQQSAPVAPEINSQEAHTAPAVEKTLPQSEVNKLVGGVKAEAFEKGRAAALAEFQRQQSTTSPTPQAPSFGGMPATQDFQELINQKVDQRFQEIEKKAQKEHYDALGNKLLNDFNAKLDAAKANYDDFDKVTGSFPFQAYPNTVLASLNFENTGDIMYELANNPTKMRLINDLAQDDVKYGTHLAHGEMQKLSDSIRINKAAGNVKTANAPLSQIQPSPTGTDSGSKTVTDLRKQLRGIR